MEEQTEHHGYLSLNNQSIKPTLVQSLTMAVEPVKIAPEQMQLLNDALRQAREMAPVHLECQSPFEMLTAFVQAVKSAFSDFYVEIVQPTIKAITRFFGSLDWGQIAECLPRQRKPRRRNTRVQIVQAKRKRLSLDMDGKHPAFKTRKEAYAFALGGMWI